MIENIPYVSEQSPQFIAGLSMGGFGALHWGAKYHHQFQAISGHSSITAIEQMALFVKEDVTVYRQKTGADECLWTTIQHYRESLPPLRFDCGTDDLLIEHNRSLHQQLTEAGIAHDYQEFPGDHSWPYWEEHIVDTLRFFHAHAKTT